MPSELDATLPEQRIVEAAAVLPDFGGVTGWAGLRWAGGAWFDGSGAGGVGRRPVVLATGYADVLGQPGIDVSQERLGPAELTRIDGLWITEPVRSLCFEMRYAGSDRAAVEALDLAAYSDLVSVAEAADYARGRNGWTGIPRCRRALALADENSWSPQETRLRLVWMFDAGLPRPLCNRPVFDLAGHHLGTPDLLDPVAGLVGEYDGSLHLVTSQRRRDRDREQMFRDHGLEYVAIMAGDGRHTTVRRLLGARRRERFLPEGERQWSIEAPTWWPATYTVAQRRALDAEQRERWLRTRLRVG